MTEKDRDCLKMWCRFAHVDDMNEDGVCEFVLKFKIRDTDMRAILRTMNHGDACDLAFEMLCDLCPGCEDFYEDWTDPENEHFVLDYGFDRETESIYLEGRYRT